MVRKLILPLLAVGGLILAVWMVKVGSRPVPPAEPVAEPPRVAFERKISGSGIVEARSRNIAVGSHLPGIVRDVNVRVGQRVKAGTPLFSLDDRARRADLVVREATVAEAEAVLKEAQTLLTIAERVTDKRAISMEDFDRRRYAVQIAEARLAGARAEAQSARVNLDLHTVYSPIDGEVLQVNIRPGEFAPTGVTAQPLVLLGNLERLHVRVDIDENDAWRFRPEARAMAFVRGNPGFRTDLRFEYVEQYVIPKRSLTGESSERVDTRVMQVIYSFSRSDLTVLPGQLMDVFIDDLSAPKTDGTAPRISGKVRQ